MIKAIFFDVDGTLLASNGKVLKSTKKAIIQAQKNGRAIPDPESGKSAALY